MNNYRIGDTVTFGASGQHKLTLKGRCYKYTGAWVCPRHGLQSESMQSKDAPKCPCGKGWWYCSGHEAEVPTNMPSDDVKALSELLRF